MLGTLLRMRAEFTDASQIIITLYAWSCTSDGSCLRHAAAHFDETLG
jgi:hypothetical protein